MFLPELQLEVNFPMMFVTNVIFQLYCCPEYEYFVSLLHIVTKETGITCDNVLDITHHNNSNASSVTARYYPTQLVVF